MKNWMFCGAAAVAAVSMIAAATPALAGPSMSVAWVDTGSNQDNCVKRASAAIKGNGFTTRFEVISNRSIYGERGDYTAVIRCVSDKSIGFVAVAGPNGELTGKYTDGIKDDF